MSKDRVLKAGALAYYDTFSGLVPCKVLQITTTAEPGYSATVKLTAARGVYKRGEVITNLHTRNVVPRGAVYRSRQHCGQYRIAAYSVQS